VWFRTKIARPEVQLPLYYIHFEITQFNSLNTKTTKLPNLPNNGLFLFHFPAMWLVSFKNPWNLIGCFVLLSHSHWLRKRCDLEQKIVHRTAESQSDCKDNQWFQNGCNKYIYSYSKYNKETLNNNRNDLISVYQKPVHHGI